MGQKKMNDEDEQVAPEVATHETVDAAKREIMARWCRMNERHLADVDAIAKESAPVVMHFLKETDMWQLALALVDSSDSTVEGVIQQMSPRAREAIREGIADYRQQLKKDN